jgi:hypothetical protein
VIGPESSLPTGEIRPTHGIEISYAAAEDLVGVIDMLALRCAPQVLSGRIVALRNRLIACCAFGGESAKVSEPEDVLSFVPGAAIDPRAAAQRLGTSEVWARKLCEKEELVAKKIRGRWWIDPDSVDQYAAVRGLSAAACSAEIS